MNMHTSQPHAVTSLATPITIQRPAIIEFGAGTAPSAGRWAATQGLDRILVIADAFNASRVDVLELKGQVTVFGTVKPEPDVPNLEAALAVAREVKPDLVIGFGGGSAMDLAKLVAVLPGSGQTLHEVVGPRRCGPRPRH